MAEGARGRRRAATREEVLRVARLHALRHGWRSARVQEIAAEAGVSRPTLYKEFPSKDDLGIALVRREVTVFITEIESAFRRAGGGLVDGLQAALERAFEEADNGPFMRAVLTDRRDDDTLVPALTDGSSPIVEIAAARVAVLLRERDSVAPDAELEFVASVTVRLTLSFLVDSGPDSRERTSRRIAELGAAHLAAVARRADAQRPR